MTHTEKLTAAKKAGFCIMGNKKSTYESIKKIVENEEHARNKQAKEIIKIL